MDWKVASLLLLTVSIASAGLIMGEMVKMRNCRAEIIDFKENVLELRITNPTLSPLKVSKIEIYRDVNALNSKTLTILKTDMIIQPNSYADVYIPLNAEHYQLGGVVYATGFFGEAQITFFLCGKAGSMILQDQKCMI
ncbi:MAG: hypothetical protein H0Z28_12990 [Archaeoglobus sp.]|nr:hypothetical protein [Archaeoglobus sp.]